ncbi:hypothetical protein H696_04427 [Fonticula alba]|uniref:Cleavage and polyadenylation specificity factor subunit 3 n=1 Tax=Fonticula alba TaxID=691883 RepID=A0A058Z683_FONAL|nr:hypothetical protein H696_04427 [Fonticula alba]KCV69007.1 hypothetical protein H696_04427 [Fonticula alba]|eukprot:XP_009496578.1 hypothetical protein H696_04427 [Fonticula alba]
MQDTLVAGGAGPHPGDPAPSDAQNQQAHLLRHRISVVDPSAPTGPGETLDGSAPAALSFGDDILKITPLGAGREVGRSCVLVEFRGCSVLLDCGIHPGRQGPASLPYLDHINPAKIDLVLVSHFHLDHIGALPYLTERTKGFKAPVYMTHATKAIGHLLIKDYLRVSGSLINDADESSSSHLLPFNETDMIRCFHRAREVNFHQSVTVAGVRFSAAYAGHVLGGAVFSLEFPGGVRVVYTGDYSREEDRHLPAAELPALVGNPGDGAAPGVDVLICESTYGKQDHMPRAEREQLLTAAIRTTVLDRGGRVLLPVFASGRAQELLLILEEYWASHPELRHVPVYYASELAEMCLREYRRWTNSMNDRVRRAMNVERRNPFVFRHITSLTNRAAELLDGRDGGLPCVVVASPGMLQSGLSRQLFDAWCDDERNMVIIAGYCVEGTLAKHILKSRSDITTLDGRQKPLKMDVRSISFSAHVDFTQNAGYIAQVAPAHLVLVHGERGQMDRLASQLHAMAEGSLSVAGVGPMRPDMVIHTPENTEAVSLRVQMPQVATVVGKLADRVAVQLGPDGEVEGRDPGTASARAGPDADNVLVEGVLVRRNYQAHLLAPEDVEAFTSHVVHIGGAVAQSLTVPLAPPAGTRPPSFGAPSKPGAEPPASGRIWRRVVRALAAIYSVRPLVDPADRGVDMRRLPDSVDFEVMETVRLSYVPPPADDSKALLADPDLAFGSVELSWTGAGSTGNGALADVIADAVVAIILRVTSSPLGAPARPARVAAK